MFGLQITNEGTGELVLSDNALVYAYLGKAVNSALVQSSQNGAEIRAGYSEYQIDYDGDIVVVLGLSPGMRTGYTYKQRSGNTHTIRIKHSAPDPTSSSFADQQVGNVYVFVKPISVSNTYGMAMYDDSGALVADLSRYPMTFRKYLQAPSGTEATAVPADVSVPAFIGMPQSVKVVTVGARDMSSSPCWELNSAGTSVTPAFQNDSSITHEGAPSPVSILRPAYGLLLDLVNLP